eukprot:767089-Hanusia_phi.AAC.1
MVWRVGCVGAVMAACCLLGDASWDQSRDAQVDLPPCSSFPHAILRSGLLYRSLALRGGGGGAREVKTKATKKKKREEEEAKPQSRSNNAEGLSRAQKRAAKEAAKEQRRATGGKDRSHVCASACSVTSDAPAVHRDDSDDTGNDALRKLQELKDKKKGSKLKPEASFAGLLEHETPNEKERKKPAAEAKMSGRAETTTRDQDVTRQALSTEKTRQGNAKTAKQEGDRRVEAMLEGCGLGEWRAVFHKEKITYETMFDLANEDLVELGMALGERKRLLKAVSQARSKSESLEDGELAGASKKNTSDRSGGKKKSAEAMEEEEQEEQAHSDSGDVEECRRMMEEVSLREEGKAGDGEQVVDA